MRHPRLCSLDPRASGALIRFSLARGARRRLAQSMAELHHDAVRPQSRTRRPPRGVSTVQANKSGRCQGRLKREAVFAQTLLPRGVLRLLRVGRFPHHALASFAPQQFDRIAIVDVTELPFVDAVSAEFLKPARHALRDLAWNAELQVFLLPHPAPAVGAGKREPPAVAGIGAAAV